jgi:hypothetical protein
MTTAPQVGEIGRGGGRESSVFVKVAENAYGWG